MNMDIAEQGITNSLRMILDTLRWPNTCMLSWG